MSGWRPGAGAELYRRVGWPVIAGAWWSRRDNRFVCSVSACRTAGPHPLVADAGGLHTVDIASLPASMLASAAAPRRWRRQSSVILPTGVVCDVIDAPAQVGERIIRALIAAGQSAPMAAVADRWLVFVAPGAGGDVAVVDAADGLGALVHTWGSWVMLPPSRTGDGRRCSWLRPPWATRWCMPPLATVRRALSEVGADGSIRSPSASPGGVDLPGRRGPTDLAIYHAIGG